ncbi:MAG: AAA family ATPase [Candidatus Paceibacterota bacterium]
MFLKRLEINGFKSFATKTTFEFSAGIVGVVGPNGSGKSNVIDAMRWLLGEREAKNLRGAKIEDLIFAGTAKKPRMSQAQVSLVFDNVLGKLPIDFKEVVITRKVSRAGVSEYFINDAEVRLKDIIDFFSKIKLGTKGLTIIGQGAGDIFVKATPQERMMMVQEILGLREYQLKKTEAQRKLKNTKINLEKIQAMIQEVGPRLRMLKRQTSRWERRFEIEQKLKDVEQLLFASKIYTLTHEANHITKPISGYEEKLTELKQQEAEGQKALEELEKTSLSTDRMREVQEKKRILFDKKSDIERRMYRLEAELERVHAQEKQGGASLDDAKDVIQKVRQILLGALKIGDISQVISMLQSALESIEIFYSPREKEISQEEVKEREVKIKEKENLINSIHTIEEEIHAIDIQEQEVSQGFESFNKRFKNAFAHLETIRMHMRDMQGNIEHIRFEQEKNKYKQEELRNYINSIGGSYESFVACAHISGFEPIRDERELTEKERESMRLRGEIASIGEIDEGLITEAQEVETHYEHLTKESQDLENASADLFKLIIELNEKITTQFQESFKKVNEEFNTFFRLMFGGGFGKMKVIKKEHPTAASLDGETEDSVVIPNEEEKESQDEALGIDIEISIPQKKITSLEMLSGGEKSLISLAVLFALISVSPPPFLVLDEVDSALDEKNSRRFSELVKTFATHTQFVIVTHNRVTMEAADVLYGVTMDEGGGSKVLSLKMV